MVPGHNAFPVHPVLHRTLTVREAAAMLRVSQVTLRRYVASGKLPAVRVGRNVRAG